MSTIVTDTLQGKTSATSITLPTTTNIGSTPLVSASANSMTIRGEGSATTNIQQGLAKCWATHPSSATPDDSFNLTSMTDSATGKFICTFNNNMASTKYIVPATGASYSASNDRGGDFGGMDMGNASSDNRATGTCSMANNAGSTGSADASLVDRNWIMHIFFGDLA